MSLLALFSSLERAAESRLNHFQQNMRLEFTIRRAAFGHELKANELIFAVAETLT